MSQTEFTQPDNHVLMEECLSNFGSCLQSDNEADISDPEQYTRSSVILNVKDAEIDSKPSNRTGSFKGQQHDREREVQSSILSPKKYSRRSDLNLAPKESNSKPNQSGKVTSRGSCKSNLNTELELKRIPSLNVDKCYSETVKTMRENGENNSLSSRGRQTYEGKVYRKAMLGWRDGPSYT